MKCVSDVEANQIVAEAARISAEVGPVAAQAQVAAEDRNAEAPVARRRAVVALAGVKPVLNDSLF